MKEERTSGGSSLWQFDGGGDDDRGDPNEEGGASGALSLSPGGRESD